VNCEQAQPVGGSKKHANKLESCSFGPGFVSKSVSQEHPDQWRIFYWLEYTHLILCAFGLFVLAQAVPKSAQRFEAPEATSVFGNSIVWRVENIIWNIRFNRPGRTREPTWVVFSREQSRPPFKKHFWLQTIACHHHNRPDPVCLLFGWCLRSRSTVLSVEILIFSKSFTHSLRLWMVEEDVI
jgi:hypothetical protein